RSRVAGVVLTGGDGLVRETLLGAVNMTGNCGGLWATVGPTWLFPIWALALGWATHRYRRRRLEAHTCGQPSHRFTSHLFIAWRWCLAKISRRVRALIGAHDVENRRTGSAAEELTSIRGRRTICRNICC